MMIFAGADDEVGAESEAGADETAVVVGFCGGRGAEGFESGAALTGACQSRIFFSISARGLAKAWRE